MNIDISQPARGEAEKVCRLHSGGHDGTARYFLANRPFFPSNARKKVDFVMSPSKKGNSS